MTAKSQKSQSEALLAHALAGDPQAIVAVSRDASARIVSSARALMESHGLNAEDAIARVCRDDADLGLFLDTAEWEAAIAQTVAPDVRRMGEDRVATARQRVTEASKVLQAIGSMRTPKARNAAAQVAEEFVNRAIFANVVARGAIASSEAA